MTSENNPDLYLELLKRALCASLYPESGWQVVTGERAGDTGLAGRVRRWAVRRLRRWGLLLVRPRPLDPLARDLGRDWPCFGYTMVGLRRLTHLQECVETVIRESVPGDLIETGVWRGGAAMLMRAVLRVRGVADRVVWAADSFAGLPPPKVEADRQSAAYDVSGMGYLRASLDEVRAGFARFGLLDDQVRFLEGWFDRTLPSAPIEKLSVLRLDGDMYESTMTALDSLYPKVSPGGFVIVDDYHAWPGCRRAVDEFRGRHHVKSEVSEIDGTGVYWRV